MPDDKRQKLKQFIPRFIGCYDDTCERARREYILCQALWVWLPLALDAGGLKKISDALRYAACDIEEFLDRAHRAPDEIPIVSEAVDRARYAWSERGSERALVGCVELAGEKS
jgi:hypothetical protein